VIVTRTAASCLPTPDHVLPRQAASTLPTGLQVSGSVYHGGDELSAIMAEAFSRYALSNPLHPDLFPGVRKVRKG
jgi:hypothetical protein